MKSLFNEREKNLTKSNIIFYSMVFLALALPFIVLSITDDFLLFGLFMLGALFYLLSMNNAIDTTFSSLKAVKISKKLVEEDIKLKQFVNIVEELKIAAGYKGKIDTYLIKHNSINAMAISRGNKAAIAITTGALEKLNREELSGVIGHEIAHIINADSDVKLVSYVAFGMLGTYAYMVFRYGGIFSSGKKKESANLFLALIITALAYLLGMIMFFALSRKRESLADVESVRLTRNKFALIKALKKIAKNEKMPVSETASSLFFANPLNPLDSSVFSGLFRTHPPLEDRIKYLESL